MTTAARAGLEEAAPAEAAKPATPAGSRRRTILSIVALVALAGTGSWYVTHIGRENTDDAQVDGEVVAVPARVAGTITHIYFVENQQVKAGDLLAEIDDAQPKAKLAQAEA